MSTDYESSYFNDEPTDYTNDGANQPAPQEQAPPAPTGPDTTQLMGVIQQLQSELSSIKANPLAGLGYQPIQQAGAGRFSPQDPSVKEAKEFLESQGVLTKDTLAEIRAEEAREEFALSNGYENTQHLAADFWGTYYSTKSPQAKAELESLINLYETGSRASIAKAVKGFTEFKQRGQQEVNQSQTFGHVPQNSPQSQQSQVPRFRSATEFNTWIRNQEPAKRNQIMADWQAGKIPDPY